MTKHESDDIPVVDRPTHSSGEKDPEIVVTREMIEAGVFEFRNFDPDRDSLYEFLPVLYRAMLLARGEIP